MPSARIAIGVDLTGDKELMRKLDKLSAKIGRRVLRKAVRAGGAPIVKAAKSRVPKDTGNLKKSIGQRFKWYNMSQTMVTVVGPRIRYKKEKTLLGKTVTSKDATGKKISLLAGQHGFLVEYGTKPRYTKNGAFRGIGPAQPFMRPAWDAGKRKSEKLAVAKLLDEVEKEARRGG